MKLENFKWQKGIYIKINDLELDMHNCYDFNSVTYDVAKREIILMWNRHDGDWVNKSDPEEVKITVTGVEKFQINPRDAEIPFTEDNCLSSFGYITDEDWVNGQFWTDSSPEPHWDWSLEFQSGAEFIINGQSGRVTLKP